jgi:hypothetical protein
MAKIKLPHSKDIVNYNKNDRSKHDFSYKSNSSKPITYHREITASPKINTYNYSNVPKQNRILQHGKINKTNDREIQIKETIKNIRHWSKWDKLAIFESYGGRRNLFKSLDRQLAELLVLNKI